MATIEKHRRHGMEKEEARKLAEDLAGRLKEQLGVDYRWEGDDLRFERSGAKGRIHVGETDVKVQVDLGLALRPMKGMIDRKIDEYLDKAFA